MELGLEPAFVSVLTVALQVWAGDLGPSVKRQVQRKRVRSRNFSSNLTL